MRRGAAVSTASCILFLTIPYASSLASFARPEAPPHSEPAKLPCSELRNPAAV